MPKKVSRDLIDIMGYVGPNGSGKTWLALKHPNKLPAQLRIRVNWADPTLAEGARVISDGKALHKALKDWAAAGRPKGLNICWDGAKKYGPELGFKIAAMLCLQYGFIEIIADEAHKYCDRNIAAQPWLDDILSRGFHYRVSFKWTSTRPKQMHPEFRAQSRVTHVFYAPDTTFKSYASELGAGQLWDKLRAQPQYSHIAFYRRDDPKIMPPYKPKG